MTETIVLGGETYVSEDGQFVVLQGGTLSGSATEWYPNRMTIVFQRIDDTWLLFDIQVRQHEGPPWIWYRG